MKCDLKRFLFNKIFAILVVFSFVGFFAYSFYYSYSSKKIRQNYSHPIARYKNNEEIKNYIEQIEIEIENLDKTDKNYQVEYAELSETKSIYQYLMANSIKYEQCIELSALEKNDNTRLDFSMNVTNIIILISIILTITLSYICFTSEIQNRRIVFILGNDRKRSNYLKNKIIIFFMSVVILMLILFLLAIIMSFALEEDYNLIIIIYQNKVKSFSLNNYIALNYFSSFIYVLTWAVLISSIALFVNSIEKFLVLILSVILIFALCCVFNNSIMQSIISPFTSTYLLNINKNTYFVSTSIKFVAFAIVFVLSIKYFNKKNLA